VAAEVVLPRQGWTMEVGSIVEWRKQDGDRVEVGDVLFTLQSDKAVNEIEALDAGVLRIPPDSPAPGVEVPIGTVLAYIVAPGEEAPLEGAAARSAGVPVGQLAGAHPSQALSGPGGARANGGRGPAVSPRARRVAGELGVAWAELRGSGSSGRIVERDVRAAAGAASEEAPLRASPAVRRRAAELGIDLVALGRARPGERIELADVEAAAAETRGRGDAETRGAPPPSSGTPSPDPLPEGEGVLSGRRRSSRSVPQPVTGIRRVIAERMAQSAREVAAVTLTTEADATELVALRERVRADSAGTELAVPSYNDLFAKILAVALAEQPELNASWTEAGIVRHAAVHVGIAVETERGLLVPVVRDVGGKSVRAVAAESARLVERARAGGASAAELSGSTITITNLGHYEIDAFTPIVNPPEAAILGVGRIAAKAVVVDEASERIAVRKMVALSLTFDHRIVDGAPAARFLQRVKHLVERPHRWVLG
jgi:pyruvate dehydrogenase E2 component (dihydrolipoamide acetyltransferase)